MDRQRNGSYQQGRKGAPVQGTPNTQQQTMVASINFDGMPEIEDDDVFRHMRDYPHKNVFRKAIVTLNKLTRIVARVQDAHHVPASHHRAAEGQRVEATHPTPHGNRPGKKMLFLNV